VIKLGENVRFLPLVLPHPFLLTSVTNLTREFSGRLVYMNICMKAVNQVRCCYLLAALFPSKKAAPSPSLTPALLTLYSSLSVRISSQNPFLALMVSHSDHFILPAFPFSFKPPLLLSPLPPLTLALKGRAIRHANDYAVLILVDKRYAQPSIRNKLPKWIGQDVKVCNTFGECVKSVVGFFKGKKVAAGGGST
jgi:hypothetical protein